MPMHEIWNRFKKAVGDFVNAMSYRQKVLLIGSCGLLAGLLIYFAYLLRMPDYLGNESKACVNCHVMTPYYATWMHSSHARDATCNDCHVPHNNVLNKYFFKAKDGMGHVYMFLTRSEHQVIKAKDVSAEVIMDNCIRCHKQLNQEFVKTGRITYMESLRGEGKACWDCHRNVPHSGVNSLASTPGASVPLPPSPVPEWLHGLMSKNEKN